MQKKLDEATEAYNKLFEETVALKKQLEEQQFAIVFENLTRDLADTQREKISKLIENISFASIDEFKRGVELMIEEIVSSKKEQVNETNEKPQLQINDRMKEYLSRL
jgi:CII-binding regulator of phage lambda lysogenization HflD